MIAGVDEQTENTDLQDPELARVQKGAQAPRVASDLFRSWHGVGGEAIVIAAQRPEMRFVVPKSEDQQALAVLFRARERLVHQRTELVNALRAVLYEFGHVVPQEMRNVKLIDAIIEQPDSDLPALVRIECMDLVKQIAAQTARIDAKTIAAKQAAAAAETARRLQTMPGVGPINALAVEPFAPTMQNFKRGREFAAWPGLVPRQHSS